MEAVSISILFAVSHTSSRFSWCLRKPGTKKVADFKSPFNAVYDTDTDSFQWQTTIGSRRFPDTPCLGIAQSWMRFRQAAGSFMGPQITVFQVFSTRHIHSFWAATWRRWTRRPPTLVIQQKMEASSSSRCRTAACRLLIIASFPGVRQPDGDPGRPFSGYE